MSNETYRDIETPQFQLPWTILVLCFLYLTISLACDPAAFRLVNIGGFTMGGAFFYGALYTLLDMLTRMTDKRNVYILILIFHGCDLIFSYVLYMISMLPLPHNFQYTEFNLVLTQMPRLFWSGILGSFLAGIADVIIYTFFQKKTNNFMISSIISTLIIMFAHNIPTDYFAFKAAYPHKVTELLTSNFIAASLLLIIYASIGQLTLKLIEKSDHQFK